MVDVCERCGFPAVQVAGKWQHAEAADAVFCAIVFEVVEPFAAIIAALEADDA